MGVVLFGLFIDKLGGSIHWYTRWLVGKCSVWWFLVVFLCGASFCRGSVGWFIFEVFGSLLVDVLFYDFDTFML